MFSSVALRRCTSPSTYHSDATCSRQHASRSSWRRLATHMSRSCQLVRGVNHGGDGGTRPPSIWSGGMAVQIAPPRFWHFWHIFPLLRTALKDSISVIILHSVSVHVYTGAPGHLFKPALLNNSSLLINDSPLPVRRWDRPRQPRST